MQDGWTPLMTASFNGHTHIVRVLMLAQADIYSQNKVWYTDLPTLPFNPFSLPLLLKFFSSSLLFLFLLLPQSFLPLPPSSLALSLPYFVIFAMWMHMPILLVSNIVLVVSWLFLIYCTTVHVLIVYWQQGRAVSGCVAINRNRTCGDNDTTGGGVVSTSNVIQLSIINTMSLYAMRCLCSLFPICLCLSFYHHNTFVDTVREYHIFLNRCPGIYFFHNWVDPVFKWNWH